MRDPLGDAAAYAVMIGLVCVAAALVIGVGLGLLF